MKKLLYTFAFVTLLANLTMAQTVILDFETPGTTTTFQYFGSDLMDTFNNTVANPDQSGINTSAMCAEHIKPAGSQTWAGAFPEPAIMTPIDVLGGGQVCIKVWMDHIGNVAFKLEESSTGGDNWIRTMDNLTVNQWEQICFDVSLPSIEGPFLPANGHVYDKFAIFFDFGVSPSVDQTYYFDDIVVSTGGGVVADVTFAVNMNDYADPFTSVNVTGSFNDWDGSVNPLTDDDSDGIWTTTITLDGGLYEYKYSVDGNEEAFNGTETCTITSDDGMFTNRLLPVSGDVTLPTVCYGKCLDCGAGVTITINLGTASIGVSEDGVFLAGGGNFGIPGDYPLTDPDGDNVYTIVLEREIGFESFYTFANGACGDFSCKEDISGQDCADPANFNDRKMGPVMTDLVINTCFGLCTDDTGCDGAPVGGNITFSVDMHEYTGDFSTVSLSGSFNQWSGEDNPMEDPDGDDIWTTTVFFPPGNQEYKFTLDNLYFEEIFDGSEPCTITDPTGIFINRIINVNGDEVLGTVCYNECTPCATVGIDDVEAPIFEVSSTLVNQAVTIGLSPQFSKNTAIQLYNTNGALVFKTTLAQGTQTYELNTQELPAGIYFINVVANEVVQTKRIVVQH